MGCPTAGQESRNTTCTSQEMSKSKFNIVESQRGPWVLGGTEAAPIRGSLAAAGQEEGVGVGHRGPAVPSMRYTPQPTREAG